ncbi:MAG: tyrosine-type recombinase/integrase [Smithella sp.]
MASIKVNRHGYLCIDFRYQGKRHSPSTGLKDTKPNRIIALRKKQAVEYDISVNNLDIKKYFPDYKNPHEETSQDTLTAFYKYYIKEKTLKPGSWRNLEWAWDFHIHPYFGDHKRIQDIAPHDVRVFKNTLLDKLAESSVSVVLTKLSGILLRAHEEGKMAVYPMKKLGRLDLTSKKIDPFSFDELRHLLGFAQEKKPEWYDMICIWSRTGPRLGEILAFKWDDLDYFNRTLSVNRTLIGDGSEGTPKTINSRRDIDLRPQVIEAFKRQEKRTRMLREYIFVNTVTGTRYDHSSTFDGHFRHLLKLANLRQRSPNQLRHTFVTHALAAGESLAWVSKMIGHKDAETTLKRYNKYIPNLTHADGSALEKAFDNARNGDPLATPERKSLKL